MSLIDDTPEGTNAPELTVSELSRGIKRTLETTYGRVRVRGELGRVTFHRNGHCYLDLKDENAVLAGVIWKSAIGGLDIRPQEGDEVIATGRITTFAGQSKYQLVIENLAYAGEGALLARLERLRKQLAAEGLFDPAAKRPLPYLPRVIGVVTSPTGAVIRDILHRLADRFPVHVLVWPVAVQGPQSAPQVAAAIRGFDALAPGGSVPRPEVLIVARGGGSVEDLWGFNDEAVVRAVHDCRIPVISAVGHETDTTLIDHAADRRAPTPSAAAEMAVPVRAELVAMLADRDARRKSALAQMLKQKGQRLRDVARALPRPSEIIEVRRQRLDLAAARLPRPAELTKARRQQLALVATRLPAALNRAVAVARIELTRRSGRLGVAHLAGRVERGRERLDGWATRLVPAARRKLASASDRLSAQTRLLGSLGYRQTLARGFAVVRGEDGDVVTDAASLSGGTRIAIEFRDGRASAVTEGSGAASRPRGKSGGSSGGRQGSLF
ncbi:exodeoxyribonuclease VII large subunit [Limibaculum sp. M0105]|uniref:Exodeoxyribonuclease 7 large subunit n=1 Tax=Thermohalobaculum xanthum TaxID=2753746 RepID=A0A8J7M5I7_9RHOB|nr:exodeoxyribonuclease VII large subunit [Thermohalobaculum xanthum]MBK0398590.1 exodeoxyribonuclease VII large subunit [Thermohalobaculum xanthum]